MMKTNLLAAICEVALNDNEKLQKRVNKLQKECDRLDDENGDLQYDKEDLKDRIAELEDNPSKYDADDYLNNLP